MGRAFGASSEPERDEGANGAKDVVCEDRGELARGWVRFEQLEPCASGNYDFLVSRTRKVAYNRLRCSTRRLQRYVVQVHCGCPQVRRAGKSAGSNLFSVSTFLFPRQMSLGDFNARITAPLGAWPNDLHHIDPLRGRRLSASEHAFVHATEHDELVKSFYSLTGADVTPKAIREMRMMLLAGEDVSVRQRTTHPRRHD